MKQECTKYQKYIANTEYNGHTVNNHNAWKNNAKQKSQIAILYSVCQKIPPEVF